MSTLCSAACYGFVYAATTQSLERRSSIEGNGYAIGSSFWNRFSASIVLPIPCYPTTFTWCCEAAPMW
jgi:hypothetical protein